MINIENKLKIAQFWLIIIIAVCLIIVTIFNVVATNNHPDHYVTKNGFIVKISDSGKKKCLISLVKDQEIVNEIIFETGIEPCF